MDFSEKWGRDVEEAVRLALEDLKVSRDEVTVQVLEEPSKGFLGLGAKLAKVRVELIKKEEPKEIPAPVAEKPAAASAAKAEKSAPAEKAKREGRGRDRRNKERRAPKAVSEDFEPDIEFEPIRERPENLVELAESPALDFLKEMTNSMKLELEMKAYENGSCLYIDIAGKDAGTIIGKRGQTLDAVQYLTSLVVNKGKEKYTRVIVDAENYREKRERTLEQLAKRLADKVRKTGKNVRLEPMNPYERKVIHSTLQRYPGVSTRSEGEEPYRRVIIERK